MVEPVTEDIAVQRLFKAKDALIPGDLKMPVLPLTTGNPGFVPGSFGMNTAGTQVRIRKLDGTILVLEDVTTTDTWAEVVANGDFSGADIVVNGDISFPDAGTDTIAKTGGDLAITGSAAISMTPGTLVNIFGPFNIDGSTSLDGSFFLDTAGPQSITKTGGDLTISGSAAVSLTAGTTLTLGSAGTIDFTTTTTKLEFLAPAGFVEVETVSGVDFVINPQGTGRCIVTGDSNTVKSGLILQDAHLYASGVVPTTAVGANVTSAVIDGDSTNVAGKIIVTNGPAAPGAASTFTVTYAGAGYDAGTEAMVILGPRGPGYHVNEPQVSGASPTSFSVTAKTSGPGAVYELYYFVIASS